MNRLISTVGVVGAAVLVAATAGPAAAGGGPGTPKGGALPGGYKNLVVIYEENHSFDNLYGTWGTVKGNQTVNGLQNATAAKTTQMAQDGTAYGCLLQVDVNLATPPQPNLCQDAAHGVPASAFTNQTFTIDRYIKPLDKTCPAEGVFAANGVLKDSPGALPGGCTRDLVHRFYQEQYQIDGGKQDRYVTGSDAVGLTMGHYDTKSLPIYQYLHRDDAPNYVIADNFFQGAFGGSFLNHQYLIAARAPLDTRPVPTGVSSTRSSTATGFPNSSYPLYKTRRRASTERLTQKCANGPTFTLLACLRKHRGQHDPAGQPAALGGGAMMPLIDDTVYPNIGDRMTAAGSPGTGTRAVGTTPRPATPVRCSSTTTSRSTTSPATRRGHRGGRTCRTRRSSWRRRRTARSPRCRSSSPTAPRTSTRATPANRTAATTSSSC